MNAPDPAIQTTAGDLQQEGSLAAQRNGLDDPEFTEEQLREAVTRVGQAAREEAFAAGRPVFYLKGTVIVALHPDGTEEVIKSVCPEMRGPPDAP